MIRDALRRSLAAKLLLGQILVIAAGAASLLLVALLVGPKVFRRHVREALGYVPPDVAHHLDAAFNQATLIALTIAISTAALAALGVSFVVSRRVVRPVRTLAEAAQAIARGGYDARVQPAGVDEVGVLANAFNEMAEALEHAEQRRRELLSDVAHELRTPLATIGAYVDGLAEGVVASDGEAWAALQTETKRLGRLVDDLQKVSRAEERQLDLQVEPVPPAELIAAAVQVAAHAYEAKSIELTTNVEGRLPPLIIDRDRLGEVLGNLLENALRHTATGNRVVVSATRRGDQVELAVADTGEGIAPEHLERVFERFYRVDGARSRATGGSGIGLAIARAIVEAHGGQIHAESEGPGCGATFVVTLPTHPSPVATSSNR